jgi:hypothetical protein
MTFERFQQAFAILCVPYADNTVVGACCDPLPIWGIDHTTDPILVSIHREFRLSCHYIHHDQLAIITTRRYVIVNRREGNGMNLDGSELINEVRKCKLTQSEWYPENV